MRPLALIVVLIALTPWAVGQRGAGGGHAAAAHGTTTSHSNSRAANPSFENPGFSNLGFGNRGFARNGRTSSFRRSSQYPYAYGSLPFPFFGDSFDSNDNDIYSTGYPVASEVPPFLMQAMRGMTGPLADSMGSAISPAGNHSSSSEPLMIELQNGRYVRVNSTADADTPLNLAENHTSPNPARAPMIAGSTSSAATPPTLPPAVLIFRDGHREEVRDYTIADGILYVHGDYYTDGYWNKKINLSSLDLAQTLQANSTRNVNFILPSSPNEVITRP
jgi:hypothetical protein